jgi:drug/metabolite transporter (DMT)-like permease
MRALVPVLLLTIPPLCWAGNFVIGRAMHAEIPPAAFTFWRWVVAFSALAPFVAVALWRRRQAVWHHLGWVAVLALTGMFTFQYAVYRGLHTTTAINGALIIATIPVFIPAIAFVIDGSRLALSQALAVAVSLAGVIVIILRGNIAALAELTLQPGDLWMLLAAFAWSVYSVVVRNRPAALPPLPALLAQIITGLLLLAPLYAAERAAGAAFALTPATAATLLYVGIFASVIAFICWNAGVARLGATRAGQFIHLMPLFAAGLAVSFLGETLQRYHAAGLVLIALGLVLASRNRPLSGLGTERQGKRISGG